MSRDERTREAMRALIEPAAAEHFRYLNDAATISIAVSAKRIADALEKMADAEPETSVYEGTCMFCLMPDEKCLCFDKTEKNQ